MYHMNRRIYESYKKSGLVAGGEASRPASRPGTAAQPATAPSGGAAAPQRHHLTFQQQRAGGGGHGSAAWGHLSMPPRTAGLAALAAEADAVIAAARPATTPPAPPSFVRRHVQNSRATLKAAILDEIVEHRVGGGCGGDGGGGGGGSRLNALAPHNTHPTSAVGVRGVQAQHAFQELLELNSGEAFYPTLAAVIEQLRAELGVE